MNRSESIAELAKALHKFSFLVGKVSKDSNNPFFSSKYASLSNILTAIEKPLDESNLVLTQLPTGLNGLTTLLMHTESGEFIESTYEMTPTKNDPQGSGSAITYMRRYAIQSILKINVEDDDDANQASKPQPTSNASKPQNDDDRPWLSEAQFEKAKQRMMDGETELLTELKAAFKMKKLYREQLEKLA